EPCDWTCGIQYPVTPTSPSPPISAQPRSHLTSTPSTRYTKGSIVPNRTDATTDQIHRSPTRYCQCRFTGTHRLQAKALSLKPCRCHSCAATAPVVPSTSSSTTRLVSLPHHHSHVHRHMPRMWPAPSRLRSSMSTVM